MWLPSQLRPSMIHSKRFDRPALVIAGMFLFSAVFCATVRAAPVTIVDNGPPANRVDIVFLGDGYTQADIDAQLYDEHIQAYLDHMFASPSYLDDPFQRYNKFFNVHKLTVVSNESGADIPSQSVFRDTALDATYETTGIERLLTISNSKANAFRNEELSGSGITADMQLATVNHNKYGGSGGSWAVYAGANSSAHEIALHELGHSFSGLSDEYVSFSGPFPGEEPSARNVTTSARGTKWSHWIGFEDPRGSNLNIDVYEGAAFYPTGIYRPSSDSKMRSLNRPFDAVSREAFIHDIYEHADPLDDWLDNQQTVIDENLWVDVVDPDVIRLQWFIDDQLVPAAVDGMFNPWDYGYGPGTYGVRVRAYDEVLDHAFQGGLLDLVRTGFDALEQFVTWTFTLTPSLPGDYNRDHLVDMFDYDLWKSNFGSDTLLAADGNDDGVVDAADYVVWRQHFEAGSSPAPQMPVPEPSGSLLLISGLLLASACRHGNLLDNARLRKRASSRHILRGRYNDMRAVNRPPSRLPA